MRRRISFITFLGGTAVTWPLSARAQQSAMPVIGFLHAGSREQNTKRLAAFLKGLGDGGFVDGHNVTIDYRWAGKNDALPALAADLVRRRVTMIVTPASTAAAVVAEQATTTIPIVFAIGADPMALGLAKSLSPARWKCHGDHVIERRGRGQAARAVARAGAASRALFCAGQPRLAAR